MKNIFNMKIKYTSTIVALSYKGFDCDPDDVLIQANQKVASLDKGDGVLVLTDMYGSTPSNIATKLLYEHKNIALIAGINLSMLVRLLNYPDSTLQQLIDKALSGGRDGVLRCASNVGANG